MIRNLVTGLVIAIIFVLMLNIAFNRGMEQVKDDLKELKENVQQKIDSTSNTAIDILERLRNGDF